MTNTATILLAVAWMTLASSTTAAGNQRADDAPDYVTWPKLEPDKCASIWLIRRFIAPGARIVFIQPETEPKSGILFDTPDAAFRRSHNRSTYESLASHYKVQTPRLDYIGRIIHDIEINAWARKALPETVRIEQELNERLGGYQPDQAVAFCVAYFDVLYDRQTDSADIIEQALIPHNPDRQPPRPRN